MSAYLILNYDIDDPDAYGEYQQGAIPALKIGSESKPLVLDQATELVEGERAGKMTVVLEFESVERAREIYDSGDYQAVIGQRHAATSNHFAVLVNGFG